ncbi:MAG TPA: tetratricopeptide repeat protein, partial [Acidimicrobiales bacterium]|nr:tetratricopeptide repeat protein [Acidimicrobiales bacterium]
MASTQSATTTSPASSNLPVALTPLVGREAELGRLKALLGTNRLVTVVGTGGCGKTRLAAAAAGAERGRFPDGCFWADLAATSGAELPVQAIVRSSLGLPQSAQDSAATLVAFLGEKDVLLVLDNCEHVAYEVAVLVELLLQHAPRLRVLATSREVIGVPGEHVMRLAGLSLESAGGGPGASEAVRLFAERASMAVPGEDLDPDDAATAARLCRQLDGLPLAIELAAARTRVLSISEIARRLEHDVGLLHNPSRTAPARQQTLAATLDWSHGMLSEVEQVLFRRLACFRGSFSLLAAESVAADADPAGVASLPAGSVLDLVAALVDKSLLQVADRGVENRYRMLETVRQYGEARLAASDDSEVMRAAHAEFYLELALHARAGLDGPDQLHWLDRLELENDNVRAALEWSLPNRPETGCRIAAALWPFWYRRGYYNEGRHWLEGAAEEAPATSPPVRAATLTAAGIFAFFQCDYRVARERLGTARELYEQLGDKVGQSLVLHRLGSISREQARYEDARAFHEASLAIRIALGDEVAAAHCEDQMGFAAWLEGDTERALELCGKALATFRSHGRAGDEAAALVNLGAANLFAGDRAQAAALLEEALSLSEQTGYAEGVAWSAHELALAAGRDEPARARALLARALRGHAELGDRWRAASVLESTAALEVADPELAARLLGAAQRLRAELGAPVPPCERAELGASAAALERRLGAEGYERALAAGRGLELGEAVALAALLVEHPESRAQAAASPGS